MPSIIEVYSYDIFISYRQKDNKHDGWVTEFVNQLKGELEATFKEDISIYFDENPSDGLLETYSVDKSLEGKLKCLIFIPVISQTYCDPKSYAWQHEFCAFNELTKKDQFGRDIRLPNGNVTSRILPVKIHDLDPEDKTLLENELGGVLRSIEFIYKEAGVNRPLKPNDDSKENLNKTHYINQVNKVANAVKEIITALKKQSQHPKEASKQDFEVKQVHQKNRRTKIIAGTIIALALIILGIFFIPKLFKPGIALDKSIAVLPFTNLSNDPEQEYFSDGIVETILNHLFKVGELKVISSTSTKRYKNTELSLKEIARELGVSSILEGSVQRIGNNVRITTQLIEAKTDIHLWSETYDRDVTDIFSIQTEVAQNVARELKATLTSDAKTQIEKSQTKNPEAYNLYLQGRFLIEKTGKNIEDIRKSIEYFEKAVSIDPVYALAYTGLAEAYQLIPSYSSTLRQEAFEKSLRLEALAKSKEYIKKALGIDKNLAEAHAILGRILYYYEWKWEEARKEFELSLELNPNFLAAHVYYGDLLCILREYTEGRKQLNIALEIDPFSSWGLHGSIADTYTYEGKFQESFEEELKRQVMYSDSTPLWRHFRNYVGLGEDLKAVEELWKVLLRTGEITNAKDSIFLKDAYNKSGIKGLWYWMLELELKKSSPDPFSLATRYACVGKKKEALNWLEKYFELKALRLPYEINFPELNNVRSEPRFQALIAKMGLTEYQIPK